MKSRERVVCADKWVASGQPMTFAGDETPNEPKGKQCILCQKPRDPLAKPHLLSSTAPVVGRGEQELLPPPLSAAGGAEAMGEPPEHDGNVSSCCASNKALVDTSSWVHRGILLSPPSPAPSLSPQPPPFPSLPLADTCSESTPVGHEYA